MRMKFKTKFTDNKIVKTTENTEENIQLLESKGYTLSPVSKRNGMNKVIRYSHKRMVYWFSSDRIPCRVEEIEK
jgi:hypothetical protein